MSHQPNDFIAETNGNCFLCSDKIPIWSRTTTTDLKSESCTTNSLDCLSRYLKIDMKKVFTGSGPIPPHLVARVETSRLKTELCEKCVLLNRKFSKLYRQWEKTEMEMTSCLTLLQENLERAVKPESKAQYWNDMNSNKKDEWSAKLEIIGALRKDTLLKCSQKLGAVRPTTKLQRLTWEQINKEKYKMESRGAAKDYQRPGQHFETNYEHINDDIGSPASFSNEDDNDNRPDEHNPSTTTRYIAEAGTEKHEISTSNEMAVDIKTEKLPNQFSTNDNNKLEQKYQISRSTTLKRRNKVTDQIGQAIPPPIKLEVGTAEKATVSKNPETGKYKCPNCSKEYPHYKSSWNHYRSIHLKVKYKCTVCKIDFPFKQVYEKHYLSIHMGVRFKCGKCNKTFTQKGHLMQHQRKTH